jgi:hypothetical protein
MVGTFSSFDPSANLAWATSIARAWTTDARIESIYLSHVRPDGTQDLSSREWNADYRFFSPTRREAQRRMREVSEQEVISELRVQVEASRVKVHLSAAHRHSLDNPDSPLFQSTCTIAQVLQLSRDRIPPRPGYDMMLTHLDRPSWWRWSFADASIVGSAPQVDAVDCTVRR